MIHFNSRLIGMLKDLAERSYPDECCGFLAGCSPKPGFTEIHQVRPCNNINVQRSTDRYEIDPVAFLRFDRESRANKREILGFYHSHPNSCAITSDYDRQMAWPGYCYLIVAVIQGQAQELRCWVLDGEEGGFQEEEIRINN